MGFFGNQSWSMAFLSKCIPQPWGLALVWICRVVLIWFPRCLISPFDHWEIHVFEVSSACTCVWESMCDRQNFIPGYSIFLLSYVRILLMFDLYCKVWSVVDMCKFYMPYMIRDRHITWLRNSHDYRWPGTCPYRSIPKQLTLVYKPCRDFERNCKINQGRICELWLPDLGSISIFSIIPIYLMLYLIVVASRIIAIWTINAFTYIEYFTSQIALYVP